MDRCEAAFQYHKAGYNCAQAVALAFEDLLDVSETVITAAGGGFGGGVGGSHVELCGAVSGGVLVLGWLTPHTDGADAEGKKRTYAAVKEFRRRFEEVFGLTRCADLLAAHPQPGEKNPAALRLGVTAHCDNMIVTAVEILEKMLAERTAD
ncbi:C-GCAxxG-C-C family protein [Oscillibacter sp.]|uniref:C-GCAxxG-C-C family protein n=1 Tax=Oscillibacter sp. TaxID=1945593 RepID=UPI0028973301|nr:C-GCAxxG-C-C family protein [Oscillibacter sp.]